VHSVSHVLFVTITIVGLVSFTVNPRIRFEVCMFSRSRDIRGSQNLKVGHVTLATLPCDIILSF